MTGKVYLIGAGPGDPELLTLKAVNALGKADVVLIDDLVSRETLQYAKPGAQIIDVGKRGGQPSARQDHINGLLVEYARTGKTVARLKGGDPFIFGRGGEELLQLQQAGIAVDIISGVTAGIAAPAAIGIPLTHRGLSQSVTFITGHTRDGWPSNWAKLAQAGSTLVIYMGLTHLPQIISALLDAGLAPTLPVAAIQHGTLPQQRSVVSTLANVAAAIEAHGIGSPTIIVVGEVVQLAENSMNHYDKLEAQQ
ncbi:MAG: uroporphyrinogen-III C-methyltransferase [Gammaproteobacteria bacterium]|nr:uroporphyrinogen-III C-methyltransferase [Gammaproteobacteria bacterium]